MDTDGQHYLIWKRDGNAIGKPTPIFLASLNPDGTKIVGTAVELITNTLPWEGAVTEGPWVILVNGTYHLFYSGNAYNTAAYAVGVAQASKISGPYTKVPNPIAHTGNGKPFYGPGHCSVVWTGRHWAMVYHAWNTDNSGRNMLMDVITWSSGYPSLIGDIPSETPQPVP
jgi:arabinan endo-1,5-alpha-L-arabinosidase